MLRVFDSFRKYFVTAWMLFKSCQWGTAIDDDDVFVSVCKRLCLISGFNSVNAYFCCVVEGAMYSLVSDLVVSQPKRLNGLRSFFNMACKCVSL